jgi:hypothetical protein
MRVAQNLYSVRRMTISNGAITVGNTTRHDTTRQLVTQNHKIKITALNKMHSLRSTYTKRGDEATLQNV